MNGETTIREYQRRVDRWVRTLGVRYFSELTNTAILMEEVGELARIMARVYGDQSFKRDEGKDDIGDELADILFVAACLANQTGVDLTEALERNLEKKSRRDRDRHRNNPKLSEVDSRRADRGGGPGEPTPTEKVRAGCRAVADRSTHVRIDFDAVASYAAGLPIEEISRPEHDPESHFLGQGAETVAFFLTLDAVNFGSGYFPHLKKRPGKSGYFTVATALTEHFRENGPLSATDLAGIRADDCRRIFGQDAGNPPVMELMGHFATAWNDLGHYLLDSFNGSFTDLVSAAEESAERLVEILAAMPLFSDVSAHGDLTVPFHKRAQLTAADLSLAFDGQGPGRFRDLDRLTIFADNLVPHVLRMDGILIYEASLLDRIESGELLTAGSPEEVEIRACAVHAVERIKAELHRSGHPVTAMGLDFLLWNRGQGAEYKARPRHRCRTVYY